MSIQFIKSKKLQGETDCYKNLNLLGHAQILELDIGSQCGGHGLCGRDQIFIPPEARSSLSPATEVEIQHLGQKRIQEGWRLGCQVWPSSDMEAIVVMIAESTEDPSQQFP